MIQYLEERSSREKKRWDELLGQILIKHHIITEKELKEALDYQKKRRIRLGSALMELGYIDEEELGGFLSQQLGIPFISLKKIKISEDTLKLLPSEYMKKHLVIPVEKKGSTLVVAMADPTDQSVINEIGFITGLRVEPVVAPEKSIKDFIEENIEKGFDLDKLIPQEILEEEIEVIQEEEEKEREREEEIEEAPIVRFVNYIITEAIRLRASDIHIEPYEDFLRVRYRIDGVLHEMMTPPLKIKNALISRIKIMSNMNIAEKRLPQDGRFKMKIKDREIDFRVSTLPTLFGEKVVIRILDKEGLKWNLSELGFEKDELKMFKKAISLPYGMILVTGPTGSGKTTTLYSAILELNKTEVNISTVEDPVEYNLPGINQVQVNESIGLTFASALRSFLRQDPDIIMVGEIRDLETAEISIKAALTGHLVLSTLHTNDAPSTVGRLVDMGVEPFLVSSSLNLVIAQRLVRVICPHCKEEVEPDPASLEELGISPDDGIRFFKGKGCKECNFTGYKGRIGIFEMMEINSELRDAILRKEPADVLREIAIKNGMRTLRESGIMKIKKGITTIDEVLRTTILE